MVALSTCIQKSTISLEKKRLETAPSGVKFSWFKMLKVEKYYPLDWSMHFVKTLATTSAQQTSQAMARRTSGERKLILSSPGPNPLVPKPPRPKPKPSPTQISPKGTGLTLKCCQPDKNSGGHGVVQLQHVQCSLRTLSSLIVATLSKCWQSG